MAIIERLISEERGADATEYGLLAALIAVALIIGARALGSKINTVFSNIDSNINNVG